MSTTRTPVTQKGADKLTAELDNLKNIERPRVIEAIAEARAHGDLKENAEYHAAREEQGFIEARIKYLEAKLSNAIIIDVTKMAPMGKVIFGTTVELLNLDTDETVKYQIVCEDEADINLQKISLKSPIAKGLIGKSEGDEVVIQTPNGLVYYEILAVEHI